MRSEHAHALRFAFCSYLLFIGKCTDDIGRFAHWATDTPGNRSIAPSMGNIPPSRINGLGETPVTVTHFGGVRRHLPLLENGAPPTAMPMVDLLQGSQKHDPGTAGAVAATPIEDLLNIEIQDTAAITQKIIRDLSSKYIENVLRGYPPEELRPTDIYFPYESETYLDDSKIIELLKDTAKTAESISEADLAGRVADLLEAGRPKLAGLLCDRLAAVKERSETRKGRLTAFKLKHAAKSLRAKGFKEDRSSDRVSSRDSIFKSFDKISTHQPKIDFVQADVKHFVHGFALGATNPKVHLTDISQSNKDLLAKWIATPEEKRIFIAGSGENRELIRGLNAELEKVGFAVFFYDFCVDCSPEVVGAFFVTAGNALLAATPAASISRYTSLEVAAAQRIREGQSLMILVTPEEILYASVVGAGTTGALVTFDTTPEKEARSERRMRVPSAPPAHPRH